MKAKKLFKVLGIIVGSIVALILVIVLCVHFDSKYGWFMSANEARSEGDMYLGLEQYDEASVWYERAVEKGDYESYERAAYCYVMSDGEMTVGLKQKVMDYCNMALEHDVYKAYFTMGLYYQLYEDNTMENVGITVRNYLEAARNGVELGASNLLRLYLASCYPAPELDVEVNFLTINEDADVTKAVFNEMIENGETSEEEIIRLAKQFPDNHKIINLLIVYNKR